MDCQSLKPFFMYIKGLLYHQKQNLPRPCTSLSINLPNLSLRYHVFYSTLLFIFFFLFVLFFPSAAIVDKVLPLLNRLWRNMLMRRARWGCRERSIPCKLGKRGPGRLHETGDDWGRVLLPFLIPLFFSHYCRARSRFQSRSGGIIGCSPWCLSVTRARPIFCSLGGPAV